MWLFRLVLVSAGLVVAGCASGSNSASEQAAQSAAFQQARAQCQAKANARLPLTTYGDEYADERDSMVRACLMNMDWQLDPPPPEAPAPAAPAQ